MENVYGSVRSRGESGGLVKIIARKSFLIKNYAWLVSNVHERWQKNENIMESSDKSAMRRKRKYLNLAGKSVLLTTLMVHILFQVWKPIKYRQPASQDLHNSLMNKRDGGQSPIPH